MPDIGAMLRETRMRERIDISEVESATKIRAKYLRALENEEWDLLPGPTFVKTFLRTYAEYLGLDPKLLVEEYKQRYERPGPHELLPFASQRAGRRGRGTRAPGLPPFVLVTVCVVLLLGALYALGQFGDDEGDGETAATPTPAATPASNGEKRKKKSKKKAAVPKTVKVQITPTGTVNVCLVDGSGKILIPSSNLEPGGSTRVYSGKRFRVTFGNGQARMRVNGRSINVPDRQDPVGYDLRPGKAPRELPADQRPTCAT